MRKLLLLSVFCVGACGPGPGKSYPNAPVVGEAGHSGEAGEPAGPEPMSLEWVSPLHRDHPLVGVIFAPSTGTAVSESAVLEAAAQADDLLLGETHDNADHHRLQAHFLSASADGRDAVAWEMIERRLDEARAAKLAEATNAEQVALALDWGNSGWPDFSIYAPVFTAAIEAKLPLRGAGLTREDLAPLFAGGEVDAELRGEYGLDDPLAEAERAAWLDELFDAHCGAMPREALGPMLLAQRLRDAAMADALRQGARGILIAGSGHVRRDRAVPALLRRRGREGLSVAFIEVDPERRELSQYTDLPYDYVVFTPAVERGDPCAAFHKQSESSAKTAKPN